MLPEDFILGTACNGEDSGRQASRALPFHPDSAVWESASVRFLALKMLPSWFCMLEAACGILSAMSLSKRINE